MMKNDNIRIKQKKADFLLYGFAYLFLILAGIFLISLPFLSIAPASDILSIVFMSIGILFTVGGGVMYGILLYRGICPKDALIITNKGFTNRMLGGKEGVYVEWVNVASMKVFGLTKAPMLGLTLTDNEAYIASLGGKAARDARTNIELGLPVIAISQRDVFLKIPELKSLFSRMIKGAISWEQYASHNKKADLHPEEIVEYHFEEQPDELSETKSGKNGFVAAGDLDNQLSEATSDAAAEASAEASVEEPATDEAASEEASYEEAIATKTVELPDAATTKEVETNNTTADDEEEVLMLDMDGE